MSKIFLASTSPRRRDILKQIGFDFDIVDSNVDEDMPDWCSPEEYVKLLAEKKAKAVFEIVSEKEDDAVVIGADTVVVYNSEILGKPEDKKDAFKTLRMLQGNKHSVYTGISVFYKKGEQHISKTDFDKTDVYMMNLSDGEILKYIESGEPMDKAGSYAIQEKGSLFIDKIEGDFYTVVGLSPSKLYKMFNVLDIKFV